jgi:tRNA-splicing ligase RtcB
VRSPHTANWAQVGGDCVGRQTAGRRLARQIPTGLGGKGRVRLNSDELGGDVARRTKWAVEQGYGVADDIERIEDRGCMAGAEREQVSEKAKRRQRDEMGNSGIGQPLR